MEQLFGAIPGVLGKLEPNKEIGEAVVLAAWTRCAGEPLRIRAVPLEFKEKRLIVAVEDATWQRHLEELSPQMIFKINNLLGQGTVRFIEFCTDPKTIMTARKTNHPGKGDAKDGLRPPVADSLVRAATAITDKDLREKFIDAAASSLSRKHT